MEFSPIQGITNVLGYLSFIFFCDHFLKSRKTFILFYMVSGMMLLVRTLALSVFDDGWSHLLMTAFVCAVLLLFYCAPAMKKWMVLLVFLLFYFSFEYIIVVLFQCSGYPCYSRSIYSIMGHLILILFLIVLTRYRQDLVLLNDHTDLLFGLAFVLILLFITIFVEDVVRETLTLKESSLILAGLIGTIAFVIAMLISNYTSQKRQFELIYSKNS